MERCEVHASGPTVDGGRGLIDIRQLHRVLQAGFRFRVGTSNQPQQLFVTRGAARQVSAAYLVLRLRAESDIRGGAQLDLRRRILIGAPQQLERGVEPVTSVLAAAKP